MAVVSLDILAERALLRLPYNHHRFWAEAQLFILAVLAKRAGYLTPDKREEVVQETIAHYLGADPEKLVDTPAIDLLAGAITAAIRTVRANNASPGERTRWRRDDDKPNRVAAEQVEQIVTPAAVERALVKEGDHAHLDLDRFPSPAATSAFYNVECAIDAEWSLRRAPPNVAVALRLIHLDDVPVGAAATFVGMDRFKLRREVKSLTTLLLAA